MDPVNEDGKKQNTNKIWKLKPGVMSSLNKLRPTEQKDNAKPEQDLVAENGNVSPNKKAREQLYSQIEAELAALDGTDGTSGGEMKPLKIEPFVLNRGAKWNVMKPLDTSSTVGLLRLCFARVVGNEYRIYDALDNQGYHYWGSPLSLSEIGPKGLQDGQKLYQGYGHIYSSSKLPVPLKRMIKKETGADIIELLNTSDCMYGFDIEPSSDEDIMCVGRSERIHLVIHSEIVPLTERHSGINIFNEATRISFTLINSKIFLDNELIQKMTKQPEVNVFYYANSSNIYVLNGRTLFENTELSKHVLPIRNIEIPPKPMLVFESQDAATNNSPSSDPKPY